ncbi:MAG: hypothetical protein ABSE90_13030, partial [Verrucomicrobiota bacterium]
TYQGCLAEGGAPANGNYDFWFKLYNAPASGTQQGGTVITNAMPVTNGLFTITLDFGAVFPGSPRWLEIYVHNSTNAPEAGWVLLDPRQPLTPAPYALYAPNAGVAATATSVNGGGVLPVSFSTPALPEPGQILAYDGSSLMWTNPGTILPAWLLGGNAGTTAGMNFLGTTDNQPLELKVNSQRVLRLEPKINAAPNIIGGSLINGVAAGVSAATISGGGSTDYEYSGMPATNSIASDSGTIGGGVGNSILANAQESTIGGGFRNSIMDIANDSTISGGALNTIDQNSWWGTIGGGYCNWIYPNSEEGTIGGGDGNQIGSGSEEVTIAGGDGNNVGGNSYGATIGGGVVNYIFENSEMSTIGGGYNNYIGTNAAYATVPGGSHNIAGGQSSFAAGYRAKALHNGAFVWADSTDADFASTTNNQFAVRALGGVVLQTPTITVPGAGVGTSTPIFIHRATAGNIGSGGSAHITTIDNPACNGVPGAILIVTHNYSASSMYETHPFGVWYNGSQNQWTIYHEDLAAMPEGQSFNVMIIKP